MTSSHRSILAGALAILFLAPAGEAVAATTELVSFANGAVGSAESYDPDVSDDGRYVAFSSLATNWGFSGATYSWHTYLLDRSTRRMTMLEAAGSGRGSSVETQPAISGDGNFVAFVSRANLVATDSNWAADVYVYNRVTGGLEVVSVATGGAPAAPCACDPWLDPDCACSADNLSGQPTISADGRYVAFASFADNLVPGDAPQTYDVFVHDRASRDTRRIAAGQSPSISGDGRFVAFASAAADLVAGDANGVQDVFVFDRAAGTFERVSVGASGEANGFSAQPSISADGAKVAFVSQASSLVRRDTNGMQDAFCRDRLSKTTVNLSGTLPAGGAYPSISANGLQGAFVSSSGAYVSSTSSPRPVLVSVTASGAPDGGMYFNTAVSGSGNGVVFDGYGVLVPEDTNGQKDVYLRDLTVK